MVYAITYDLNKPGQDYPGLFQAIEDCGDTWHYLDSFWLVDTGLNASEVSDIVKSKVDQSDYFLVIAVTKDYQGWLPRDQWKWIELRI
jgi:hypothetical protein